MWFTLALALTLQAMGLSADSTVCSDAINTTAALQFSDSDPDLHPFRKPGRYLEIDCCGDGFTDIEWYFTSNMSSNWRPWPWFSCQHCSEDYHQLRRKNQTLIIFRTGTFDTGWYLCNVSNSDTLQYIQRRVHLVVADCDDLDGNIRVFEQPGLIQNAALDSNLTLTCGGNFGCPAGDMDRHANWSYVSPHGKVHPLLPDVDDHYSIVFSHGVKDTTVSSMLTVNRVRSSDFSNTYICDLSTNKNVLTWNLTIQQQAVQEKLNLMEIAIPVGVVGGFVVLLGLLVVLYWCYKPQVDFRYNRMRGNLPVRGPNEEHYHDTAVVHSDSEKIADFVEEEIRKPLQDDGYDVFTKACTQEGAGEMEQVDAIGYSMGVILVLNAAEVTSSEMQYLMATAIECHGTRMVVIDMKEKESTHTWKDKVDESFLNALPKILKTVTWHGSKTMSRRQKDNLLYTIKSHLPEPGGKRLQDECTTSDFSQRQLSNSSTAPLIPGGDQSVSLLSQTKIEMEESKSEHPDFEGGEVDDDVFSNDMPSGGIPKNRPPLHRSDRVSSNSQFVKQLSDDSGYAKSPCVGSDECTRVAFKDTSQNVSAKESPRVIHAVDG
ncbi:uncharacterized protein LOC124277272 [Haliotis rubra]|uniref:uncharacterized protein LOC124277272 n=1 Tax=Haliotis rubra TaxID=36100 RepID=UPI001EE5666C|nr:uncharacterized protein LOC124277272 [Haliotis rubra]